MKATIKVQVNGTNTTITLPKDMREYLEIKKGDTLLLTLDKETQEIKISK